MKTTKISKERLSDRFDLLLFVKRLIVYCVGFAVFVLGCVLIFLSSIGSAPGGTIAEALVIITGLSLGTTSMLINVAFIGLQLLLIGKKFGVRHLLQIPASILFSALIQLFLPIEKILGIFLNNLPGRILVFVVGIAVFAIGNAAVYVTELPMPPSEENIKAIIYRTGWELHTAKTVFNVGCVVVTVVLTLVFLGHVERIGVGTIINALIIGRCVQFCLEHIKPYYMRFIDNSRQ